MMLTCVKFSKGITTLLQEVMSLASPVLVKQLSPKLGALSATQLRAINSTSLASGMTPFRSGYDIS